MSKIDLKAKDWCELVFEGRNKEYGAYDLRAKAGSRQLKAIISILALILVIGVLVGLKMAADAIIASNRDLDAELATELSQLKKDEPKQEKRKKSNRSTKSPKCRRLQSRPPYSSPCRKSLTWSTKAAS